MLFLKVADQSVFLASGRSREGAKRNRAGVCYQQLPQVQIKELSLSLQKRWKLCPMDLANPSDFWPQNQIPFQIIVIHMSTCPHLGCQGYSTVISNRHMCLSCLATWAFFTCHTPCSFWDSPSSLSLSAASHFPQCVYSFGPLPRSFHHLRILLPILTSSVPPWLQGYSQVWHSWRLPPSASSVGPTTLASLDFGFLETTTSILYYGHLQKNAWHRTTK